MKLYYISYSNLKLLHDLTQEALNCAFLNLRATRFLRVWGLVIDNSSSIFAYTNTVNFSLWRPLKLLTQELFLKQYVYSHLLWYVLIFVASARKTFFTIIFHNLRLLKHFLNSKAICNLITWLSSHLSAFLELGIHLEGVVQRIMNVVGNLLIECEVSGRFCLWLIQIGHLALPKRSLCESQINRRRSTKIEFGNEIIPHSAFQRSQ